jgi:hypothetical protein
MVSYWIFYSEPGVPSTVIWLFHQGITHVYGVHTFVLDGRKASMGSFSRDHVHGVRDSSISTTFGGGVSEECVSVSVDFRVGN